MPLSLSGVFYLIFKCTTWQRACACGFIFGLSFFIVGLWWVFGALSGYIGLPIIAAAALFLLLCAALALYYAAAAALGYSIGGKCGILSLAGWWAIAEWLRGELFSGFPWLAAGYSQVAASPLSGWLPLAGIDGMNFVVALAAALALLLKQRLAILAIAALLTVGYLSSRYEWTQPAGEVSISLLQGNVKQGLKWDPAAVDKALDDYLRMADESSARWIILPETALPLRHSEISKDYLSALQNIAARQQGAIISGLFVEEDDNLYNAAVAIGDFTTMDYRKRHLTPYGEYLPFANLLRPILLAADIPYNGLSEGARATPMFLPGGKVALSICYEDAFSDLWRAQLPAAQALINITNDGWFDGSIMLAQHLQMSQARAAEFGRYVARATNTGMTAIIDHRGQVVAQLPPATQGALDGNIILRDGATPYARFGPMPALLLSLILIGTCYGIRKRR